MREQIEVISYQDTAKAHHHSHTQIVLPLSGSLVLEVGNKQDAIQFGQACLISPEQAHTHLARTQNRCLILNALPSWNENLVSDTPFINLSKQASAYLPFLSALACEGSNPIQTSKALDLLEFLLPIPQETIIKANARLEKAKYLLDMHFNQAWNLTNLAQEVHLSASQLSVLFKRQLGMTPKRYLDYKRLEEAKLWLTSSNKGLEYIADKVGLHDASALVRLFTKYAGTTPGQYRANLSV